MFKVDILDVQASHAFTSMSEFSQQGFEASHKDQRTALAEGYKP